VEVLELPVAVAREPPAIPVQSAPSVRKQMLRMTSKFFSGGCSTNQRAVHTWKSNISSPPDSLGRRTQLHQSRSSHHRRVAKLRDQRLMSRSREGMPALLASEAASEGFLFGVIPERRRSRKQIDKRC
jgi:hypothetical protein